MNCNVATFLGFLERSRTPLFQALLEVDDDPFIIDALGLRGGFGEDVDERKSFGRAAVGGEVALDRVGDGGNVRDDGGVRWLERIRRAYWRELQNSGKLGFRGGEFGEGFGRVDGGKVTSPDLEAFAEDQDEIRFLGRTYKECWLGTQGEIECLRKISMGRSEILLDSIIESLTKSMVWLVPIKEAAKKNLVALRMVIRT
ncbi:hypothetical protein VNO78_11050 [Psophocarpus tetragonolobus]|uniref:Uncharacterized protein n=1 Tax=Psophocarpus tetragonolobus TaxID=3891 RepID=A0AAN9SLM8_PSOTE